MMAKDATFYVGEGRFPRETHCSKGFFDQICQAPGDHRGKRLGIGSIGSKEGSEGNLAFSRWGKSYVLSHDHPACGVFDLREIYLIR